MSADDTAFPCNGHYSETSDGNRLPYSPGLSRRELFAAMAMQAIAGATWAESTREERIAEMAVKQADALLAELEKQP